MKGEEAATIETPPNHKLFNDQQVSPVLQRHLDTSKNVSAPPTPIVNISLGKEISDLLRPIVHSSVSTSTPRPSYAPDRDFCNLLPPSLASGKDMSISEFCDLYALGPGILEKFTSHLYKDARVL